MEKIENFHNSENNTLCFYKGKVFLEEVDENTKDSLKSLVALEFEL